MKRSAFLTVCAADVVLGHVVRLRSRHFYIEAGDAVVGELQRGESRAVAFAAFEFQQEFVGVRGDAAQFVELGVVAGRDHVAVAQDHRRFFGDGVLQQREHVGVFVDAGS